MMQILRVLGNSGNASKILPCRGDSLLERVRISERRDGVREWPGEKRRSDTGKKVGGIGATPYRGKPLGGTGSALDHGGRAGFQASFRQPAKSQHHEHDGVCLGA